MIPFEVDFSTVATARQFSVTRQALRVAAVAVHGNLVIATSAASVALTTMLLAGLPVEPLPLLFVFVAAWFAYGANRLTDRDEDARNLPERVEFVDRYGRMLLLGAGSIYAVLLAIVAVTVPRILPLALLPAIGIAIYASAPVKRYFPIKNGVVGAVWAVIPFGLGLYYEQLASPAVWLLVGVIFWHIVLAAMLFDIKDIEGDRTVGSRTLPVLFGARATRRLVGIGAIILAIPVAWASIRIDSAFLILGIYPVHLLMTSRFATEDRGPLFYGFAIDAEHVLVALSAIAVL